MRSSKGPFEGTGHADGTVLAAWFSAAWDPAGESITWQRVILGLVQELLNHHFYTKTGAPDSQTPKRLSGGACEEHFGHLVLFLMEQHPHANPTQSQERWRQQGTSPPLSQQSSFLRPTLPRGSATELTAAGDTRPVGG